MQHVLVGQTKSMENILLPLKKETPHPETGRGAQLAREGARAEGGTAKNNDVVTSRSLGAAIYTSALIGLATFATNPQFAVLALINRHPVTYVWVDVWPQLMGGDFPPNRVRNGNHVFSRWNLTDSPIQPLPHVRLAYFGTSEPRSDSRSEGNLTTCKCDCFGKGFFRHSDTIVAKYYLCQYFRSFTINYRGSTVLP